MGGLGTDMGVVWGLIWWRCAGETDVVVRRATSIPPASLMAPRLAGTWVAGGYVITVSVAGGYTITATMAGGYTITATMAGGYTITATMAGGYTITATMAGGYTITATMAGGYKSQLQ